jgi:hypothetical protein
LTWWSAAAEAVALRKIAQEEDPPLLPEWKLPVKSLKSSSQKTQPIEIFDLINY